MWMECTMAYKNMDSLVTVLGFECPLFSTHIPVIVDLIFISHHVSV